MDGVAEEAVERAAGEASHEAADGSGEDVAEEARDGWAATFQLCQSLL
jgi:hypothetical protein